MPTKDGQLSVNEVAKFYEISSDVKYIKMNMERLVATIEGNGKPGLKQEVHDLKRWHNENDDSIHKCITNLSNRSYLKRTIEYVIAILGGGGILTMIQKFL